MTGDSHSNDESNFLDEDFVIEEIAERNDDLDDLFEEPPHPKDGSVAANDEIAAYSAPISGDTGMLFAAYTEDEDIVSPDVGMSPIATDSSDNGCDGSTHNTDAEQDASNEIDDAFGDTRFKEAKDSFVTELDALLQGEDEFALEYDEDFPLGDLVAEVSAEVDAFAESTSAKSNEGEGLLEDTENETATDDPGMTAEEPLTLESDITTDTEQTTTYEELMRQQSSTSAADGFEEVELGRADHSSASLEMATDNECDSFDLELDETDEDGCPPEHSTEDEYENTLPLRSVDEYADGSDDNPVGWEPLPSTSMDALSEVDEVQRTDDDLDYDTSEYEDASEDDETDVDPYDADGHDIYAEEGADQRGVVLGGPWSQRSTTRLLLSVAASLLLLFGASLIVVRPELFGLSVQPDRVAKVEIARPTIEIAIVEPAKVLVQSDAVAISNVTDNLNTPAVHSDAGDALSDAPATASPLVRNPIADQAQPRSSAASSQQPQASGLPSLASTTSIDGPVTPLKTPVTAGSNDAETEADSIKETVIASGPPNGGDTASSWPVARATPNQTLSTSQTDLARFGDDLMVGGVAASITEATAVDGVMPGSRAFAQLQNGNYFIGKVKAVADEHITLRVETGEVTLATAQIVQLTRLGTADYDELQKATKGFVRLTNNNRLVGGILKRIADDHIVLEFRSNRVMLPKSAVGEIVSGEGSDDRVRIGTTSEEESWIKSLSERELGGKQGLPTKVQPPVSDRTPR